MLRIALILILLLVAAPALAVDAICSEVSWYNPSPGTNTTVTVNFNDTPIVTDSSNWIKNTSGGQSDEWTMDPADNDKAEFCFDSVDGRTATVLVYAKFGITHVTNQTINTRVGTHNGQGCGGFDGASQPMFVEDLKGIRTETQYFIRVVSVPDGYCVCPTLFTLGSKTVPIAGGFMSVRELGCS